MEDLEKNILLHRMLLSLLPQDHADRWMTLNGLALALMVKYEQSGRREDMEESINFYSDALTLRLPGHPDRFSSLRNLAKAFMTRYEHFGKTEDMENAISSYHDALSLCPLGRPDHWRSLNNLSNALMTRYEKFGKIKDLEDCITFHRDALTLLPLEHPDRILSLHNLAVGLMRRYNQFGKVKDLEGSISLRRDVLTLLPPDHPDRAMSLNNLANSLRGRYHQFGKIEDLEDCISFHRDALCLRSSGHPDRFMSLNNLANALTTRYDRFGEREDLKDRISLHREGLTLLPVGHPDHHRFLTNLANGLSDQYDQSGDLGDLEDCVSFHRDALRLCSPGHPEYAVSLNNLATALKTQYDRRGKIEDLDNCISFHRNSLENLSSGDPKRYGCLSNLANALLTRHGQSGKIEDMNDCISYHQDALSLLPPGHPDRSMSLNNLANALGIHYQLDKSGRADDLQKIFTYYEQAASDFTSYLKHRLQAAVHWALIARHHQHRSTLDAFTTSLQLLNRSLISRPSVESQHRFLATGTTNIPRSLASDAASAAIQAGNLKLAVEFLEQGKAMLRSRVYTYKYPLEQLRQVQGGEELADRLETLSTKLEHLVLVSSRTEVSGKKSSTGVDPFDVQMKLHRTLSEEWEGLVGQIRKLEGMSNFLQAPTFDTLQSAATEGPIIFVNVSHYRSDAIILRIDCPPVLVPLPNVRIGDLGEQVQKLESEIGSVLRYLWKNIACHVVASLTRLGVQKKSRIWWCPTGELCSLPLHAAGTYRRDKSNLPDIYTSSYTSTLSSLIRARANRAQAPGNPKLLVVGQPSIDLERVVVEVDAIKEIGPANCVDVLLKDEANREAVLHGLKQHSWVHFACHGRLGPGNNAEPFQASFELDNGRRLPLLDLIQARLPNAEFAFLSACHSAAGDSRTPDESIHLSAALQFCGFRSVVGTLWEMDDEDGPMISKEFYTYMFRNPGKIDFRDSAFALSSAIRAMRKAGLPPERWVMFVHIGA